MPQTTAAALAAASYSPAAASRSRLSAVVASQPLPTLSANDSYDAGHSDSAPAKHTSRPSVHAHSRSELGGQSGGEATDVTAAAAAFPHSAATVILPLSRARKNREWRRHDQ